ncbi:MAG: hypothetical protein AAFO76_04320 [Cyanobacteria bacterium J06607_15]
MVFTSLSQAITTMKETTPAAMSSCFDKWCKRFDDLPRTVDGRYDPKRSKQIWMI